MAKTRTRYVCSECGKISPKALGRCPQCGAWSTMIEEIVEAPSAQKKKHRSGKAFSVQPTPLGKIETSSEDRYELAMEEFSRVLGGGIVPGSIVLVGGDPGIGKSTLLLQLAMELSQEKDVLYVSGEESGKQIKMRADRLLKNESVEQSAERLYVLTETNMDIILEQIKSLSPEILIIDSIQTMYLPELSSSAGSVTQVRECSSLLREEAKTHGITVFLIGHVTKEGVIAGPRVLEHIVDTVLYLEGDRYQSFRLLRSVKNRFGATSEVGVFEMVENGMKEVLNPSEAFLAERMVNVPGSSIAVTMEGTRPLLVEIQGLTSRTGYGNPRRTPNGVDFNRLLLITAVLTRRLGLRLAEQDIFVNVIGGLRIGEPAADLAIAAAVASSMQDIPVQADVVLIGEIGLSGELRWVGQMEARLREAEKLGFQKAVIPRVSSTSGSAVKTKKMEIIQVRTVKDALKKALIEPH